MLLVSSGDAILSAGCSGGRIIFFSAIYGLVTPSFDLDRYLPSILGESTMEASYMVGCVFVVESYFFRL